MNQPGVFISCVSPEFRQTRSRVAAILTRLGYTPVIQEIFGTEPGDLRQVLRDKIDACEGLIQIIGQGYGAEPPTVDAEFGRVSYTQFEFFYARSRNKKTWLLFAGEACARDTPLELLDLPSDPAHPNPAGYQAERRTLQLAYCNERKKDGHLYYESTSDTELELKVERLRNELADLGRAFKLWQKKVLIAFSVGFVLLALIGGSIWWFGYEQHKDIQGITAEAQHITKEKIRDQLLASVERARKEALAQAEKAQGWKERERLRQAAEKTYEGSVSRIDELAASFADIEGTERSTNVFNEMSRILAEEGADQALAYAATQRSGILEKVKARADSAREQNRAELLPLLKSAQLQANRNQPEEAERLYTEILDLEPAWLEARNALAGFLIQRGEVSEPAQGNAKLREAVQICQGTLALNPREKSPQDFATTQDDLGVALYDQALRSEGGQATELLAQAVAAYRSALEVRTREQLPQDWAQTQSNLGNALYDQALRSEGAQATELLAQAVAAYRSTLEVYTRAQFPQDWARTQTNLGLALSQQGVRSEGVKATELLAQAVAAYHSALEVFTREQFPQQWAGTQLTLGATLKTQSLQSEGAKATELLAQAAAAYRSALEVFMRGQLPYQWAVTQNALSDTLGALSNQLGGEEGLKQKREAVELLRDVMSYQSDDLSRYRLASALGDLAFKLILNSQFAEARAQCEEAQSLVNKIGDGILKEDRDNLIFIQQNLAHALLFQGHYNDALTIYRQNWNKPFHGKTFGEVTVEDFAAFDKAGLSHPDLSRMKQALGELRSEAPSP
jgi:tetratricopeptide (TPR) repeat protein